MIKFLNELIWFLLGFKLINKKIGVILIFVSFLLVGIFYSLVSTTYNKAEQLGCFGDPVCGEIDMSINIIHFAFGIIGFVLALGVYLIFFYSGEEAILRRLEEEKNKRIEEDTFAILSKAMDEYEKKIFEAIREQDGISQNTLVLRTGFSKSKVSEVLKDFEKKNLVRREKSGKINHVFLV